MEKTYDLIIIGGGASGLAAAVTASKNGKKVVIFEKEEKLGKKILVTGNGKCNLSNANLSEKNYNTDFVKNALDVSVPDFFRELGLATKETEGRIYPYSESALSVVSVLRKNLGCDVVLNCEVKEIVKSGDYFEVNGYKGKNVLLATGSRATKGTDSLYLYEKFGHTVRSPRPAIVPLITDTEFIKGLSGIRVKGIIKLLFCGRPVAEERGEILFKSNGVSGIASMMISSYIARKPGKYDLSVDLIPDVSEEDGKELIKENGGEAFLQKAVAQCVEKQAAAYKESVFKAMKDFRINDARLGDISSAQVVSGGLVTSEFDENFMSKKVKGLYAAGEALDVDGDCGGYNLDFAFSSGIKVGRVC